MKLTLLFATCLIFTITYQVEGGLVKDLFGKVQKTAEIVREDVKKVWRPDSANDSSTTAASVPEVKPAENDKKSDEVSKPTSTAAKPDEKEVKHEEATTVSSTTITAEQKEVKQEEATTVSSSTNTTEGEGRENFKAKCATGFGRTPDGRCKPTF